MNFYDIFSGIFNVSLITPQILKNEISCFFGVASKKIEKREILQNCLGRQLAFAFYLGLDHSNNSK